jgi:hypothetical protein
MCLLLLDSTPAPVSHRPMRSQLADAACRSLSEDVKRMTPEQRLAHPTQSALLMADVAESLAGRGVRYAVIGAIGALSRPSR